MAEEEQSQEKTEQPSAKRLKESREKGQVARSKDFNSLVILLFTGIGLYSCGEYMGARLTEILRQAFEFDSLTFLTPALLLKQTASMARLGLISVVPILLIIFLVSLFAPIMMGGWVFSGQSLSPKFSRLSPLKGFGRMVSVKGFMEMLKSMLKFVLIASLAVLVLKWEMPTLMRLAYASLEGAIATGLIILVQSFLMISAGLILIAVIDVPFQHYEHQKQLRMTKQELKDEYKETEGKPEVKSQIRRAQQDISRRRMMSEVPKASVVLTNPTHFAVAILYEEEGNRAPVVVAKGKDMIALQINKIAKAHNVPILTAPPLTRAVYFSTKLNQEIPRDLYLAIAQILAYIFQLKDKDDYDTEPEFVKQMPIPKGFQYDSEGGRQ